MPDENTVNYRYQFFAGYAKRTYDPITSILLEVGDLNTFKNEFEKSYSQNHYLFRCPIPTEFMNLGQVYLQAKT